MSGYIGQFSYLTKLTTLTKKLEFIQQQTGFESLGVVYYTKKTLLKFIGGLDFFAPQPIQTEIGLEDFFELSINQFNKLDNNFIVPNKKIVIFKEAVVFGFLGLLRYLGFKNLSKSVTGSKFSTSSGLIIENKLF